MLKKIPLKTITSFNDTNLLADVQTLRLIAERHMEAIERHAMILEGMGVPPTLVFVAFGTFVGRLYAAANMFHEGLFFMKNALSPFTIHTDDTKATIELIPDKMTDLERVIQRMAGKGPIPQKIFNILFGMADLGFQTGRPNVSQYRYSWLASHDYSNTLKAMRSINVTVWQTRLQDLLNLKVEHPSDMKFSEVENLPNTTAQLLSSAYPQHRTKWNQFDKDMMLARNKRNGQPSDDESMKPMSDAEFAKAKPDPVTGCRPGFMGKFAEMVHEGKSRLDKEASDQMGKFQRMIKRCEKANEDYEDGLVLMIDDLFHTNMDYYLKECFSLGISVLKKSRYAFGLRLFSRILKAIPIEDIEASNHHLKIEDLVLLCKDILADKNNDIVIKIADIGIKLYSNNTTNQVVLYLIKAKSHRRIRDLSSAYKDAKKSTKLQPDCADGYFEMGMCHLLSKEKKEALKSFKKCLEIDPKHKNSLSAMKKLKK
eukprot:TRINITY_DN850_c0_g1_i2.p1 TRINITY_DN850_c0_g1~~TRINITY_DN850_c0_g1_i2.p1  ORF type:complete len:484 (+),score=117.88 TRINITY_DN850_c0_g1_i2:1533-2984(+)